ncbi:DPP IV N-terminal domain-containing protein [Oceanicoccus sagamiensis]|uniref:Dipeptidylpeptidase IV N-terminal domain-containing protein n=1 Tax=Oceanicoccus sagamiensis TaxID=716816 RepID=A0A1X9NE38_9GAMM|nr:DPP IV N-terminal domain-containing protein [Oceanicoccus sagamiensis]ARN73809.1 hypothetical protein BST96_06595 [Oceanicoccus sagamiensis]
MKTVATDHCLDAEASIAARYQRAQQIEQGVFTKNIAFNTTLYPHWIGQSDSFWYLRESRHGHTFRLVDAASGSNKEAFDHQLLATALSAASGETILADQLPITDLDFTQPDSLSFSAYDQQWCYTYASQLCEATSALPSQWLRSPDGRQALYIRDHNLWHKNLDTGAETPLTIDGGPFYRYASTPSVYGRQELITLEALWSPDSTQVLTQVLDSRNVPVAPLIVEHVPADGSLRPKTIRPDRRMAFTGDDQVEAYRFLTIKVETGEPQWLDHPPCPVCRPPYIGFLTSRRGWWDQDSRHYYLIDQKRGGKTAHLLQADSQTGTARPLIKETSDFSVNLIPITHIHMPMMPLPGTGELIWYSERSGHAHLYLYDLTTGHLKNAITQGRWQVRNTLHFDPSSRTLYIQTAGRVPERNPYYCDICRVNIDTGELTEIISTEHEYIVCDQRSRITYRYQQAAGVSPSGKYVVTTSSRVDEVPVSILLDRDGNQLQSLETADVSGLPENCHWPEPVMLKAADGETDIYGIIYRPSNFDPGRSYPVLDCTYNYAANVGSFTNNNYRQLALPFAMGLR